MLMAIDNLEVEDVNYDGKEAVADLEGELVNFHEEIERTRKKNKAQKEVLIKDKVESI